MGGLLKGHGSSAQRQTCAPAPGREALQRENAIGRSNSPATVTLFWRLVVEKSPSEPFARGVRFFADGLPSRPCREEIYLEETSAAGYLGTRVGALLPRVYLFPDNQPRTRLANSSENPNRALARE